MAVASSVDNCADAVAELRGARDWRREVDRHGYAAFCERVSRQSETTETPATRTGSVEERGSRTGWAGMRLRRTVRVSALHDWELTSVRPIATEPLYRQLRFVVSLVRK
jgi:hypothetical protein